MLARGETVGLFQLNGSGMTKYLMELRPTKVTDIMAMVALYRPGPIESIPEFIRRKNDPTLIDYPEPRLKDILESSYGILVYQDDVMMTAIKLAGYDWMEADKFRKAMGKKIPEEMAKQEVKFREGCLKNAVAPEVVDRLWDLIRPFAAYGFNKAHACSYGIIAYQTAYLKANWPAEYMAAVLTAESGDSDEVAKVSAECEKMGIRVLPPDVNSSKVDFTYIDDGNIRFGLLAIKGLGQGIAGAVIEEREARGPFRNVADFAARVGAKDFNKKSLEALIKTGAMDGLGERNQLLASLDVILDYHKAERRQRESGQFGLFGATEEGERAELNFRVVPSATKKEMLAWERELLGLYVSEHPFREYAGYFGGLIKPVADLATTEIAPPEPPTFERGQRRDHGGTFVHVGGVIMEARVIMTKKNEPMAFVRLEDETGSVEAVVFPKTYADSKASISVDALVLVRGRLEERDGERKLLAEQIVALTDVSAAEYRRLLSQAAKKGPAKAAALTADRSEVRIVVPSVMRPSMAAELKRLMGEHPGPRKVVLVARGGDGRETGIATNLSIALASDLIVKLEAILGRGAVLGD
jgi:DNA polymerase-3 subunit alpha